jgi:membrane protein DedA with SNARE-associated domain
LEQIFLEWLKEYGYIILFLWSILEGETGLIMAGLLSHTGDMNYFLSIFVAGLGGFTGDQIYFFIGRHSKRYMKNFVKKHRSKFALAHLLLEKYGWPLIFMQRYMYGLRTIIPMSIGVTRYSAKKFAFINLLSAWVWAGITISLSYYFGEEILDILKVAKEHWYYAIPILVIFLGGLLKVVHNLQDNILNKEKRKKLQK